MGTLTNMGKNNPNIKDLILDNGQTLIYRYIRGSHMYHLNTEDSDVDTAAVFINPLDTLLGLRKRNDDYSADEKNDNVGYDIEKYMGLLVKSNPTVLESLFADESCIIYEHPIMKEIKSHRDEFLIKDCLRAFLGYAYDQIAKAKGYNKLCAYPEDMERKQPLDFCFTFNDYQGTEPISQWLEKNGLKQIYCGLNHLSNMNQMYGVFYDWGQHVHMEYPTYEKFEIAMYNEKTNFFWDYINNEYNRFHNEIGGTLEAYYNSFVPKGYHGIVKEDGTSCDIHLDSILKGDTPITYMSYNMDGYQSHCRMYKEWKHWKEVRNEVRYKSNFGTGYDAKNIMHCIRLLRMAVELGETGKFNLNRELAGDKEYLLNIKAHKYEYEDLLSEANLLKSKLETLIKTCNLPEHVDENMVSKLLIKIRKEFYNIY